MKLCKKTKQRNDTTLREYKDCRNEYFTDSRNAKRQYDKSLLASISNGDKTQKQWWNILKKVGNLGKPMESIPPLEIGDSIITDDQEKAEMFNMYVEAEIFKVCQA